MTTEEDLLGEAYFKEYGGDLEDLDADAEEALLRGSDDENEYETTRKQTADGEKYEEGVEYVDEDGNLVDLNENEGVQFVEYTDSYRDNDGYESAANEEIDDVLEIVVDADLEFDDGVVQENVSVEENVKPLGKPVRPVESSWTTNRRKLETRVVDDNKDEGKQCEQPEVAELSRRDEEYYQEQTETRVESSESEDEEERSGRGRFHSERSNIIQLTTTKRWTNIPDTLDGVFQASSDTNRSDFSQDRRNKGRDNSRVERRDRDHDRGSRDSHRSSTQQPGIGVRSDLATHHSQRTEAMSHVDAKTPVSSAQLAADSRGSRKILINPHFKGSSARSSTWLGDTPPKNDYVRETAMSNRSDVSSHQQQHHLPHNINTMQSGHIINREQHPPDHRPPPFSYELSQPPLSQPNFATGYACSAPPPLANFQPRLPVPSLSDRLPTNIAHGTMGPLPNVYNQRDVLTHMPVNQTQPWQNAPHPTLGQPVQIQDIQNCNQWSNSHSSISQHNAQLPLLPPNHSAPQRWPHSAPLSFPSQSVPQASVVPPQFVDHRLVPLPDVRRPPPNHLNQLQPIFNSLPPPPPVFRMDAPPPVNRTVPMWQTQPNRLPSKPLLNSMRPPLFDHPPPPLLGNMPSKFPSASIAPQMQRERQHLSSQFNMMNNNSLLNVPTRLHQQPAPLIPTRPIIRSLQQPKPWSSPMTRQRVPNSLQFRGKRSIAHDVVPQKVLKTYDKQIAWRNTNIKEVKLVEILPSDAEFKAANSSKPPAEEPPEAVEDEETRRYREQIELQKQKREEIMKMKELRRQNMALQRRKELIERQKMEKQNEQQQSTANATTSNDNVGLFPNANLEAQKPTSQKQRVVSGSGSSQRNVPQTTAAVKKRVVMVRKVPTIGSQGDQQSSVQVQVGQNAVGGNVRVGKPKPQVQIVSPQIVKTPVQHPIKRPVAANVTQQRVVNDGSNAACVRALNSNASVPTKRVIIAPKTGMTAMVKRVQPRQIANTGKPNLQRTVVASKQVPLITNQQQRTVVLNSNAGQASKFVHQAKGASSGSQQTQRQVLTSVSGPASVLIENLALATSNEAHVRKLCQSVGQVEAVNVFRDQRKAIVTFKSQEHAYVFMEKYQR